MWSRSNWLARSLGLASRTPSTIADSGEIALRSPSPEQVWALSAFAEQIDLGVECRYRLTPASVTGALAAGLEIRQVAAFLERASRKRLPVPVTGALADWARAYRRVRLRRTVVVAVDEPADRTTLMQILQDAGWVAEPLGDREALVTLGDSAQTAGNDEARVIDALRAAGFSPHWMPVQAPPRT
jgi:hypothetical protein